MKKIYIFAVVLIVLIIGIYLLKSQYYVKNMLPLSALDKIENWNFKGAYTDNIELKNKAEDEIKKLNDKLGIASTDYEIYVSIANQYMLIGDGKKTYEYLNRALVIDSNITGLAWHNMGVLLERLKAPNTAKIAYERAFTAQNILQYQTAYIDFLQRYFPDEYEKEISKTVEETPVQNTLTN